MYKRGYWDALIEELAADGIKVYDNRGRYGKNYRKSSWSDGAIGVHDTSNPKGSAPTNPAIRRYDVVVSTHKGEPYVMFNRPIDARRGSVYGANDIAGPQIAYGGPVGGDPSEVELGIMGRVTNKLRNDFPETTFKGHGELFREGPKGKERYSEDGRLLIEGKWYPEALAMGGVPEHQRVKAGPLSEAEVARLGLDGAWEPETKVASMEEVLEPPAPVPAARPVDKSLAEAKQKPFSITAGHPMQGQGQEMVKAVQGADSVIAAPTLAEAKMDEFGNTVEQSKPVTVGGSGVQTVAAPEALDIPVTSVKTADGTEIKDITGPTVAVSEYREPEQVRQRALIAELEKEPELVREVAEKVAVDTGVDPAVATEAAAKVSGGGGAKGGPQQQTPWESAMLHQMQTGDSSMLDKLDAAAPVKPLDLDFDMPKFNFKLGSLLGGLF